MTDATYIATAAGELAEQLSRQRGDEEDMDQFARSLRELLPLSDDDRVPLARALHLPVSLGDAWVEDAAALFDRAREYLLDDDVVSLVTDRLAVFGWAWGEPPEAWPENLSEAVRDDWRQDLDRVLT